MSAQHPCFTVCMHIIVDIPAADCASLPLQNLCRASSVCVFFFLVLVYDLISLSMYDIFSRGGCRVAAGHHHDSVTFFKDNEPVAESTADQSNLRVRLNCSFRGGSDD